MSQEQLKIDEEITPSNVGAIIKLLAIAKRLYANMYMYYRLQRKNAFYQSNMYVVKVEYYLNEINDCLISVLKEKIVLPDELNEMFVDLIVDAKSDYNLEGEFVDKDIKLLVDKLELNFKLLLDFADEVKANLNIRNNMRVAIESYKQQFGEPV